MVVDKKLTYPDIVRLIKIIRKSNYGQKYQNELIDALIELKE